MTNILNSENINPDNKNEINIEDVHNAVVKRTGKNPHIQCIREVSNFCECIMSTMILKLSYNKFFSLTETYK